MKLKSVKEMPKRSLYKLRHSDLKKLHLMTRTLFANVTKSQAVIFEK